MPTPLYISTLKGETQGDIKGEVTQKGHEDHILLLGFEHKIHSPVEGATGLISGKRVHGPLIIRKEVDMASPLLYNALCTAENLTDVVIEWWRIASTGQEEHYFTTTLQDAKISEIKEFVPDRQDPSKESYRHIELVSFLYRKILWEHVIKSTSSEDEWSAAIK
jgi:type VI secretion system secreted protein Hcp